MTLAAVVSSSMQSVTKAVQPANLERALGTWHSTEQFEGEPRVQFAFRQRGNEIVGWVVMLGQQRKNKRSRGPRAVLLRCPLGRRPRQVRKHPPGR
jgi:hypothetical protein